MLLVLNSCNLVRSASVYGFLLFCLNFIEVECHTTPAACVQLYAHIFLQAALLLLSHYPFGCRNVIDF